MRLGFGKKKDSDVDEYMIREYLDRKDESGVEKDTKDEHEENIEAKMKKDSKEDNDEIDKNISDYIDLDDLNYSEYEDIVSTIEENGWHIVSDIAHSITTLDTQIVLYKLARANRCDTVLEITCPQENIITICGLSECAIDIDDFYNKPNIFQVPHFFTLMCTDINGVELLQTTLISILKYTKDGETIKCYEEFYGDLSPVIGGKLKKKEERYHFAKTVILQGGEKLIFIVNNPGIDISKVDLLMISDFFEKDEE